MTFRLRGYRPPDFAAAVFENAPDAAVRPAEQDGTAPEGYHAMTIFPEYFKIKGQWQLAGKSRMDCVPVLKDDGIRIVEFRHLKKGDAVICGRSEDGSEGIFVHADGFGDDSGGKEAFAFRTGRSRESSFSGSYQELQELLRYERDSGHIVWVMGPAFAFDLAARDAFSALIRAGYADAVLAGNALAVHDLEAGWKKTALGVDLRDGQHVPGGHYNHLDTINRVRRCGGIGAFLDAEGISDGIMHALEEKKVPYVLAGSIRDDGPLPPVYGDVYKAQDAMRAHLEQATTVICMASALHSIACGNMTPSFHVREDGSLREVYFYCVDISEFTINKLGDRGSLTTRGIVTNVQDFIVKTAAGLGVI